MGRMVTVFSELTKDLRLYPARKRTHEAIKQQSDKATFVR